MGKIVVLDDHIANQIAAGEVVERPSSVVKELVENSIDAGSSRIDVAIEEGGLTLIRITDDGSGMEADDCEIAFQRHATSKIATSKDLFSIRSLGFRGEALPSIASVSKLECVTSTETNGLGRRIVIEGGVVRAFEEATAQRGTDIYVRELFFNTPARLKYMKTIQTELGHVSDYMYRLALAHPGIAFSLKHNGNLLLQTLGNGDLLQVIAAIYGTAVGKQMLPLQAESLDYAISGFIAKPEMTRANRGGISSIVNGRYVRNFALNQALLQGYHTLLPVNRFPVAVLQIKMDPALVDVNVHPSKLEVRFSKEAELVQLIEAEVRRALGKQVLIPQGGKPASTKGAYVQEQMELVRSSDPEGKAALAESGSAGGAVPGGGGTDYGQRATIRESVPAYRDAAPADSSPLRAAPSSPRDSAGSKRAGQAEDHGWRESLSTGSVQGGSSSSQPWSSTGGNGSAGSARKGQPNPGYAPGAQPVLRQQREAAESFMGLIPKRSDADSPEVPKFPRLSPIGQMHGTYLIAQNEEGLFLIDQHAAHERINYEYYYDKFGNPAEASQELLVPITLEFTSSEAAVLREKLALFEQAGVFLESFGGNTFLVRAHPHWFPSGEEKEIVEDMCEWLLAEKKSIDIAKLREKSAILCSCKASIKANQSLSLPEMEALLDRLGACKTPYTCPHGRPIVISFSTYELEKLFKRVM